VSFLFVPFFFFTEEKKGIEKREAQGDTWISNKKPYLP
jgi:hypothetical protein